MVAAHAAYDFFEEPCQNTFDELVALANKATCGKQVRATAIRLLETGEQPFHWVASSKSGQTLRVDAEWPLPMPDYLVPLFQPNNRFSVRQGPHYDVLIDMAIAAKKPEDVLHWFDKIPKEQKRSGSGWIGDSLSDRVAAAVAKSHPDRCVGNLSQRGLQQVLPRADISAYELPANSWPRRRENIILDEKLRENLSKLSLS